MKKGWEQTLVRICDQLDERFHLKGKRILDVGCGWKYTMVQHIAKEYEPELICGIDPAVEDDAGERFQIKRMDARHLEYEDNSFDFVYSNATFEHIEGVDQALSEMRRVLKPTGKVYFSFAPAWTSVCGYHGYNWRPNFTDECVARGDDIDENIVWSVPAWGHLYLKEDEMRSHLAEVGFQGDKIENLVDSIYHNSFINRISVSRIKSDIMNCGMIVREYHEEVSFTRNWVLGRKGDSELTPEIANRIVQAGYALNEIGITHIDAILEKYEMI